MREEELYRSVRERLEPCPHCGHTATLCFTWDTVSKGSPTERMERKWFIECMYCGARTKGRFLDICNSHYFVDALVSSWNRRVKDGERIL